jgi:hypothetical protein
MGLLGQTLSATLARGFCLSYNQFQARGLAQNKWIVKLPTFVLFLHFFLKGTSSLRSWRLAMAEAPGCWFLFLLPDIWQFSQA